MSAGALTYVYVLDRPGDKWLQPASLRYDFDPDAINNIDIRPISEDDENSREPMKIAFEAGVSDLFLDPKITSRQENLPENYNNHVVIPASGSLVLRFEAFGAMCEARKQVADIIEKNGADAFQTGSDNVKLLKEVRASVRKFCDVLKKARADDSSCCSHLTELLNRVTDKYTATNFDDGVRLWADDWVGVGAVGSLGGTAKKGKPETKIAVYHFAKFLAAFDGVLEEYRTFLRELPGKILISCRVPCQATLTLDVSPDDDDDAGQDEDA